jgi:uncharacterized damage-inducible protein DinB
LSSGHRQLGERPGSGRTLRVMTEDRRTSRNPGEPAKHGPSGAERWADYLDWLREDIIDGVLGLPLSERTASRLPSGWSPIELLSHLLHMEQRWFVWGFLGERVPDPWGDWNVDDPSVDSGPAGIVPAWRVADGAAAEDIAALLRDMGRRTRKALDTHGLEERARVGGRFTDDPPTLEWICFHVLAEYARHAGQFDVVRELSTPGSSDH